MKKVSIIVPVYNVEDYLRTCLNSIISQTYPNLEIIIVDDGSTDSSAEICDTYKEKDDRIKVFHKKNEGLVVARKYGLQRATGEYTGFVDSDDYIKEDMYEKLVELIEACDADFVHGNYITYDGKRYEEDNRSQAGVIDISDSEKRKEVVSDYFLNIKGSKVIPYSIWSKLYKTVFIKCCYSFVPDKQSYGEDCLNLLESLLRAKRFAITEDAYYFYRIREESLSHLKNFYSNLHWEISLCECLYDILENNINIINKNLFNEYIEERYRRIFRIKTNNAIRFPHFYYKDVDGIIGKKIILYGAGEVCWDYCQQFANFDVEIVAIVDKKGEECNKVFSRRIYAPQDIMRFTFDLILLSVYTSTNAEIIKDTLIKMGISSDKIVWSMPQTY